MKSIVKYLLVACLLVFTVNAHSQSSVTLDATQQYSFFKFVDSQANVLSSEYSAVYSGAYEVGYRWTADFGLIVRSGVGMRNAGATLVYDDMNYLWDLKYASASLGVGYVYNFEKLSPYFVASGYFGYMVSGTQILNNEHFNVLSLELLNPMDFGLVLSPGVEFKLSRQFSTFVEFKYLMGLNNIEMNESQQAFNNAFGLTLGVALSFGK